MKIPPVGDQQTDMTKLRVDFRNFANAPKNLSLVQNLQTGSGAHLTTYSVASKRPFLGRLKGRSMNLGMCPVMLSLKMGGTNHNSPFPRSRMPSWRA